MEIIYLETGPGDYIPDVLNKATIYLRKNPASTVKFEFNGIFFTISKFYHIPDLWVEYRFARLMGWTQIGPVPREMNSEIILRIAQAKKKQEQMMKNAG